MTETSERVYEGGCFCDAVRFEVTGPVVNVQVCHCSICWRLQGSSFGALFRPKQHIFYADRLYDFNDGLPKFKDMSEKFGGSGIRLDDAGRPLS